MCVFYLVIGLAASVILTNLVNSAFMHIPLDLSPEPFVWISGVFANGQSIKLFGIFMMLVLLLCVMYFRIRISWCTVRLNQSMLRCGT